MAEVGEAPRRNYSSARRGEQARRTRQRVITAATAAFLANGYAATTMRAVAGAAGVAVPTIELMFGTKSRLLKAAIDVAIAGDDEPVPVLERDWTASARAARSAEDLLAIATGVLGQAQVRSAGLVLAVFEGAASDGELAALRTQLVNQRAMTAAWLVDRLAAISPLRAGRKRAEAIDTLWLLIDPVVFERLVRQRRWSVAHYERWLADSIVRLLIDTHPPATRITKKSAKSSKGRTT